MSSLALNARCPPGIIQIVLHVLTNLIPKPLCKFYFYPYL